MKFRRKTTLSALCALFLASCGGDGGGGSPPPPPASSVAPSALSYPAPPSLNVSTAIAPLAPTVTGSVISYAVSPALPAGLVLNGGTGIISGTPTAISPAANYVVTASNSAGNTTATLSLTVNEQAPSVSYGAPVSYTTGVPVNLVANSTGGAVVTWTIDRALPAGLEFNTASGGISGTPTAVTPSTNYLVTATNPGGNSTAALTLTVNAVAPEVSFGAASLTFTVGVPVNLIPSNSGGMAMTWSLDHSLPAGLQISSATGAISGTPAQSTARADYVLMAQNSGGTDHVDISIAVVAAPTNSGVLLNLGHTHGEFPIAHDGSRIMSGDDESIVLWDAQSGAIIASTSLQCPATDPCIQDTTKWALKGPTAVIRRAEGFETWSSVDGSLLASITWPVSVGSWWRLASDGSYIVGGNSTGLTVWSPTGTVLFSRSGNQNAVNPFAAAGELRLANGPAGNAVIEHVALPAGTSTVTPAFSGTFHSWFMDGDSFFSNIGTTIWMYSHAAVQRDLVALPTTAGLAGQGNWAWTVSPLSSVLSIYRVGASATPTVSYTLPPGVPFVIPSTGTICFTETSNTVDDRIAIVDLSGATPIKRDYISPFPYIRGFASASANDWVFTNVFGVMLGELGGPPPIRYSLGAARSIAGSDSRFAVATASGSIFYFDASTRQMQGEITFTSGKIQMSADGNVLAASAESGYAQYATDRTLKVFSLPSEAVLATWPHSYPTDQLWDFTLSGSGTVVGQVTLAGSSTFIHSATLLNGTPVWTQTAGKYSPIRISPDGSRIAMSNSNPPFMTAPTTNTYINGILSGAATGFAVGWVDDNRLLVSHYEFKNHVTNLTYTVSDVVNASGQLITASSPIPELSEMQVLPGDLLYSPQRNEVYELTTGQRTWSSQESHVLYGAGAGPGAVAGSNVIFASKATVRIEPL